MTEDELFDYLKPYEEVFRVHLWAKSETAHEGEILYHFMDDLGVTITINPKQKVFEFSTSIDCVFILSSGKLGQVDNEARFEQIYYRFRDAVIKFKS